VTTTHEELEELDQKHRKRLEQEMREARPVVASTVEILLAGGITPAAIHHAMRAAADNIYPHFRGSFDDDMLTFARSLQPHR
jgi:6-phosphogluconolactonase/glucosamine-6-phosphate isomerase/deaminase